MLPSFQKDLGHQSACGKYIVVCQVHPALVNTALQSSLVSFNIGSVIGQFYIETATHSLSIGLDGTKFCTVFTGASDAFSYM